jgi:hypothetical protein
MATKRAQHHTKKPERDRKTRISARVRAALRYMVEEGLSRSEAAEKAGLRDNSLYVAMRRPETLAFRTELMNVLRSSASSRSLARVDDLASNAASEHVRLAASELLLGLDGHVPVARTEGRIVHDHVHHAPGLIIIRHNHAEAAARQAQMAANPQRMIDVTPSEPVAVIENGEEDAETNIAILRDRSGAR